MRWNEASYFDFEGKSMETDTTTWSEFPNEEIAIVEQVLASNTTNSFIFLVNLILIYIYTFLWGGSLITSCYDDLFRDEPKIIKNVIFLAIPMFLFSLQYS